MAEDFSNQFCEHINNALRIINENPGVSINEVIDRLCEDICFWDSNTEISRKCLSPLKFKSHSEVVSGLEYIKSMYMKKGNPFFHPWED